MDIFVGNYKQLITNKMQWMARKLRCYNDPCSIICWANAMVSLKGLLLYAPGNSADPHAPTSFRLCLLLISQNLSIFHAMPNLSMQAPTITQQSGANLNQRISIQRPRQRLSSPVLRVILSLLLPKLIRKLISLYAKMSL